MAFMAALLGNLQIPLRYSCFHKKAIRNDEIGHTPRLRAETKHLIIPRIWSIDEQFSRGDRLKGRFPECRGFGRRISIRMDAGKGYGGLLELNLLMLGTGGVHTHLGRGKVMDLC
jgi:hypothetical protein